MRPLDEDLRLRIVEARASGAGTGEVSRRFSVSRKSVERFWNQHCSNGHCRPKQIGGYRVSRLEPHDQRLRQWIAQQPDLTLVELQLRCQEELEVPIGLTALWHRLDRLGLNFNKNVCVYPTRNHPAPSFPSVAVFARPLTPAQRSYLPHRTPSWVVAANG